jgi:hypothetical protein
MAEEDLVRKVTLATHARGLIIRNIPTAVLKLSLLPSATLQQRVAQAQTETMTKKLNYALEVRSILKRAYTEGVCRPPISDEFRRALLGRMHGRAINERELFRTDLRMSIAFTLNNDGDEYVIAGIAAYGASDLVDGEQRGLRYTGPHSHTLNSHINDFLEIDLVCAAPGLRRGVGSALLSYVLAYNMKQKRRGRARWKGFIMEEARGGVGVHGPIRHVAERFGFHEQPYHYTDHNNHHHPAPRLVFYNPSRNSMNDEVGSALPEPDSMLGLCPAAPRSGRAYCV